MISLSEYTDAATISIDDLAVTADTEQMHLVQRSTGRRVSAYIPHALDVTVQTPVLARFIAEVGHARSAVFGPLNFGAAARTLPYTPRIRYRRTILAPARWTLTFDDLTSVTALEEDDRTAARLGPDERWEKALHAWRHRWRVPARVIACHGDLRLPLDLDQPLDRALLHHRLSRADRLELWDDDPADGNGWLGRPAELVIPMTLSTPKPTLLPVTAPPGRTLRPATSPVVHARLTGNPARFDELLTRHLPAVADSLAELGLRRWWIRRHRDTIHLDADQYVSLVVRLNDPAAFGPVVARLSAFTADLHDRGLPAELTLASYHEHPARYGHGPALEAAEHVFAADTAAAISQLRTAEQTGIATEVLAAVSMAGLAAGLAPDAASGYRALLACLKGHTEPADRALTQLARRLADPAGEHRRLRDLPGGEAVTAAWQSRHEALTIYWTSLLGQRDPATVLRTLLHEHHIRAVGVDPQFERKTNHLARAVAMRNLAPAGAR